MKNSVSFHAPAARMFIVSVSGDWENGFKSEIKPVLLLRCESWFCESSYDADDVGFEHDIGPVYYDGDNCWGNYEYHHNLRDESTNEETRTVVCHWPAERDEEKLMEVIELMKISLAGRLKDKLKAIRKKGETIEL